MPKKIISLILVVLIAILSLNSIAKADEDIKVSVSSGDTEDSILYSSLNYTQMDDLSVNTNKGSLSSSDKFVLTTSDNKLSLYVNEERCIFKVKNNVTGYVYSSALENIYEGEATASTYAPFLSSSFVIQYYNKADSYSSIPKTSYLFMTEASKYSSSEKEDMGDMEIYPYKINIKDTTDLVYEKIEDGIKLSIKLNSSFKNTDTKETIPISVGLNAYITLTNDGFNVYIPDDEITEENLYLASIFVMPSLGASRTEETKGYMVIPDGSGALLRYGSLSSKEASQRTIPIYSTNDGEETIIKNSDLTEEKRINLPIFGMVNGINQDGVYGIIKEGQYNASLVISPSGSLNIDYNFYTVKYQKRKSYLEYGITYAMPSERNPENIDVNYKFLSNDEANYIGLANDYQDYLIKEKELIKTSDGTYRTRLDFLLGDSTKALIGTKNLEMTRIKDVENILEELRNQNLDSFFINLLGWSKGGYSGTTPVKIKYNTSVSTRGEFIKLIENEENLGSIVSFYNDYVVGYSKGNFNKRSDVSKSIMNLRMIYTDDKANLYTSYYYLYPESSLNIAKKDVNRYKNNKISSITLDSIGYLLYSYYQNKNYFYRESSAAFYQELLEALSSYNTYLIEPNAYLFKYADGYLDMPLYTTSYNFYTDTIPLLSYILRGEMDYYATYMNFSANQTDYMLRMLDYGALPSYVLTEKDSFELKYTDVVELYTTKYQDWKNTIILNNSIYEPIYKLINESKVVKREVLLSGVVLNEYSNGLKIIINYTSNTLTYDSKEIGANSFKVVS